jgi:signal transduction histidine kinase
MVACLSLLPNVILLFPFVTQNVSWDSFKWPLLVWAIFTLSSCIIIAYVFARFLLLPLTKLNHNLLTLQQTPSRFSRLPVNKDEPKEVTLLRVSFNNLLQQLDTEQRKRTAFMAALMHDLKTPLIAVGNLLTVVEASDDLSREERIHLVSELHLETDRLIELVQKMVDAHKFEHQEVELRRVPCQLHSVVDIIVTRLEPFTRQRGLEITRQGEAEAWADPKELERALYNLIGNATRYARSTLRIEVGQRCIRVCDDGPGLPGTLEVLAQPFNSQPRTIAGQSYTAGAGGLGLFIARRILEAHGGRLVDESQGQGTILAAYL